jgi:hypothetical protein
MDIIKSIHEKIDEEQLLFVFRGDISDKNSLPLLTLLENEMKIDSFGLAGRKRLFMFVLESLQNISKHGERNYNGMMPLVTYSRAGEGYRVLTANVISTDNVGELQKRLEKVNSLTSAEIKDLYKNILMNSEFSNKGGAGLGLIEMAIKTGNKLDFDFQPAGNGFSYFILSKTVDSTGIGMHNGTPYARYNGVPIVSLEHMMADNDIHMIWSGHLSSVIGEEVLSLAESRFTDEDVDTVMRKRIFSIMVEMLENVSKYNPGRELEKKLGMPLMILKIKNGKFIITTGNLILNNNIKELEYKIDQINNRSLEELKELYYSSLSNLSIEAESTGNLGLVSMARKSAGSLDYSFEKINDLYSYFKLTVKVGESSE